jgi:outer membrane protein OmpA-like peptidoglycan-associated protein
MRVLPGGFMRPSYGFVLSLYVLFGSSIVYAEGSAEFDAADTAANFRHDQALTQDTVLHVDIIDGTTEQVCWKGNGSLNLYQPDGTTLVGAIANGGCRGGVMGVDGAYLIDMLSNQTVGNSKNANSINGEWDIRVCLKTVSAANCLDNTMTGNERVGRLWSYLWNFQQNASFLDDYSINGSVFAIVPGGAVGHDAVIEMQMRGVSGAHYQLTANSIGPEDSTSPFARVGRSTTVANHRTTPAFPLYLNLPEIAQYNWVAPMITDVVLSPSCGTGIVQDGSPGTIRFTSNVTGQYVVICDANKDSVYDFASPTDFSSFGAANPGTNMISWDGKDNSATNVTPGDYNCLVRLNVGEFHYDAQDIETAYPGIRMFRVESDKTTRSGVPMFWDDTSLTADAENMGNSQLSPNAPLALGLDAGLYASPSTPFYYAGGDVSMPNGNARAWGNFDADGKGNDNFLDQFAAADTAISTPFVVAVYSSTGDADNDGLTSGRECMIGANPNDEDSDGDGVLDGEEATMASAPNTDNDGPIDILDPDSDNDGVGDGQDDARLDPNACRDMDSDACDDCSMTGANNSGGATSGDGIDTDGDGLCNTGDGDDDGDGVPDAMDDAPLDPMKCRDTDGDGCDDCSMTGANGSGGNAATDGVDTDDDGLCNDGAGSDSADGDPDDDDDGVPDGDDLAPEDPTKCRDVDQDGCDDCSVTGADRSGGDPSNDGPDPDHDGMCTPGSAAPGDDTDGDGVPNSEDLDADNDGIPNTDEGLDDLDGDGVPNWLDLDSDGDGVSDIVEAGGGELDANGDGRVDQLEDTNPRNGWHDPLEKDGGALPLPDTDGDGTPDFLDVDDDGDGVSTKDELNEDGSFRDSDDDGKPDHLDVDDDGDGIPTADELNEDGTFRDTDGDGTPDHLDADDDDDGILTSDELNGDGTFRDTDGDGKPDHLDSDDDGDGVSTRDERTADGRDRDTDGDGKPDHLDTDDDGDGIATKKETRDADHNGTPDRLERPRKGVLAGGALCSVRDAGADRESALGAWLMLCAIAFAAMRSKRRRRLRRCLLILSIASAGALTPLGEHAQAQVALDQLRLAPLWTDGFGLSRPVVLPHGTVGALLALEYANDPLVYERTPRDPDSEEHVVSDDLVLHAVIAVGLWDRVTFYAGIPVHLVMSGDDQLTIPAPLADGAGLGDVSVGGRVLIAGDESSTAALAGEFTARIPTADWADKGQSYRGDAIGSYEPALVFEIRSGGFDIRARGAARLRKEIAVSNLDLGQELAYGLGMRLRLAKPLWLHAEAYGSTYLNHPLEREHSPAEALLGAKFDIDGWGIGAAAGPGLLRGFGSPDFRVVGMLGYAEPRRTVPPRVDTDHDGLYDDVDACPRDPEDKDGFKDADGCPDPDNDEDGIPDVSDRCRNKPEDIDQFEDTDGCPDPDNDKDGILDAEDKCPMEPEDADGFEDTDGCPDPDNDKDHILDVNDACPTDPEDFDGFEDDDGCPEEGSGLVKLTCEKIEIKDSVYFDTGSDHIQERSFTLLNQVAAVLQSATQIKRLRVEGHTDDRGKNAYNLELSKRRAASVMRYLLERGIADDRLTSEGYGETRPIADNKTAAGRSQNRRVEFVVVESEGCP